MKRIFTLAATLAAFAALAQKPTHHTDSTGNLYWRKATPVYLFISDNPDGPQERLKSQATPEYADPFYLDTEGVNYIRSRNAVDPETGRVIPDTEVLFEIYADGLPPITSTSYEQVDKYANDGTTYYKAGLRIGLQAKDQLSGVRKLLYKINDGAFAPYSAPISFAKAGVYTLAYSSEDMVGNVETTQTVTFTIDPTPPYSDLTVNGITEDMVISLGTKMYILALDSISGVADVFYRFNDQAFKKYRGGNLPFADLDEGDHTVTYYATDQVNNVEQEKSFSFFLDKSAPLMVADVLGDRFIVEDEVYFSGRTKLKLTAVDNKVGVKEVMYSVDGGEFKKYDQPFYLPSVSGTDSIRYYSVDNLNNSTAESGTGLSGQGGFEEFKHNVAKFYVDLTGPVIDHSIRNYSFMRDDTLFIGPYSKIRLSGKDPESGLQYMSHSLENTLGETNYEGPFTLSEIPEGYHTLEYFGYDNVNNRNTSQFSFYLDKSAPRSIIQFNTGQTGEKNGKPVYPVTAGIFLSAVDQTSGVSKLSYALGNNDLKPYAGLISGLRKGKHQLRVQTVDFLGNTSEQSIEFYIK